MHRIVSYLPQDRIRALAENSTLPDRTIGSALFADISGFTPLTEKLTQTLGPRKGVDELSRLLNLVYGSLIVQVEKFGGSIISFAGDAVIGWFDEPDTTASALRAVTCAQAMQSAMKEFDELSLKVSITTGPARRFAVGDPDIQFLDAMAGDTISRLAVGEQLVIRDEIILDSSTHMVLKDFVKISEERNSETSGETYFLMESLEKSAEEQSLPSLEEEKLDLEIVRHWLLPSVFEREHQHLSTFLTELRPAVPIFVGFSGIAYDDDDDAGQKLDLFIANAQRIIAKYEGSLLQLVIGDKGSYIYAVFGAPIAHEDDAERAVHAALEIRDIPKQMEFIQSVQMGISLGTLRVGAYGSATRRTFAALGDDVNLSARLMTTATPGEILITGRVQIDIGNIFTMEPHEPIPMKGKGEPQPVFAITGVIKRRATRLPEPSYRLPMIGRKEELALIEEKLKLALQGKGQVVAITAEAGMGKSRLAAEVIRLARKLGFVGYGGACQSSGTSTPYLVWKPIWSAIFDLDPEMPMRKQIRLLEGEIEDRVPNRVDALPLLGPVLDLPLTENEFTSNLDPKDRRNTLEVLLEEVLKSVVQDAPLLIVLEDLHWIDPLSQGLFETLARISEDLPVCFIPVYRPPDQARFQIIQVESLAYFTRIELDNLTSTDAEQLIRAKLAMLFPERTGSLPKELAEELTTRSQGNPFFIEELLNFLHDRGLDPYDEEVLGSLDLPASLQMLILSRIDQLTETQKVTLKVASVIGRVFPFSWLYGYYPSLGDEKIVREHLSHLSKLDLTPLDTPDPELAYLFKHIVTQEVAYSTLSYSTRARLHESLAKYLETIHPNDPPLNALAYHYGRSENTAKKREYLRRSGIAAYAVYANETALEYYEQALETSPEIVESIEIHLAAGEVLMTIGKRNEARAHFRTALNTAEVNGSDEHIVQCRIKYASTLEDPREAIEWLDQALELARKTNYYSGICDSLNDLSNKYWRIGRYDEGTRRAEESLELARQKEDKKREAFSLFFIGSIISEQGRYRESHGFFERALTISMELNDARRVGSILLNWGTSHYYEGDYETAERYISECLSSYSEIGDKRTTAIATNNLGNIHYLKQDYRSAEKHYRYALTLGRETNDSYVKVISCLSLGITAFMQGQNDKAEAYYVEGMILAKSLNLLTHQSLAHCYQGLLALRRHQLPDAMDSFQAGLTIAHDIDNKAYGLYNLTGLAGVHLAMNKPALSVKLLAAIDTFATSMGLKLEPEIKQPYEQILESVKSKISEAEYVATWDTGRSLTFDEAVELAGKG